MTFGARLRHAMDTRGPLCVGIDPHPALMERWGMTDSAVGLERFAMRAAEALAGEVAVIKPQSAFYERHGAAGVAVLEKVITESRARGALVLLDVKRGDIGSTNAAYADAYLAPTSPLAADAITVSPFLGAGSLGPLVDSALAHDAGLFVLALTSNPEGAEVQQARGPDGRTVAGTVLATLARHNAGAEPMGSLGAVVGATIGPTEEDLAINGPLLAPGLGSQGGTVEDLRRVFGELAGHVLPSTSRDILDAGPERVALRDAAARTAESLAGLLAP